jgi:ATP-binding cassette, subfamily B, bacterial
MAGNRSVVLRGLKVLGSYVAMHPWPFVAAVAGATVYALATVASTIVLGQVVDRVLLPAFETGRVSAAEVALGAGAIMGVAVVFALGVTVRRFFAGLLAARVQVSLRTRVVDRYRELPLAYHQANPTGELLAHTQADVEAATEVLHPVPFSLAVVLLVVLATVALFLTDLVLAAVGALVLPVLVLLNRLYSQRVEGPARRVQARIGDVSTVAHESIDGALVVKTLGRERAEVDRLAIQAEALRAERVEVGTLRAGFYPAFNAVPVLGIIVLLGFGAWRVASGVITVGTLVQFIILFQLLTFPMQLIGFVLSELPRAVVSRDRLEGVFSAPLALPPAAESVTLDLEGDGLRPLGLSVRSLRFAYGRRSVLDGVSFEVPPGSSVALVGPTGAGKSTIAELLVRLADPDDGSIRLGGHDLRHLDRDELRAAAALVLQDSFLFRTSVRENITLGQPMDEAAVRWAARLAQAERFIDALPDGLDTVVGERGVTLSGGQRQRIALARALARRPRLLILDDATSAVDPSIEAEILAGLRGAELSTTLVLIAYRVSTITLADRVLFLDGGRIAAAGSHAELLAHPAYAAMVQAYARSGA